ncbi:nitrous oxide reductase accessory protein NosL [Leptospira inadai]|uniref:Accessory protein NosL n=2 Tax=Leptospira inadai serovar Lyme TaxID=293084 RepID=A0ABX4YMK7_9LEPT|nr:nitrous oxide reductase accessory protein NosL [Leptospira inadai]PNV76380.1 accessory protein NosL [Leptospira inadai serovar Lyme]
MKSKLSYSFLIALLLSAGCTKNEPIVPEAGREQCQYCSMSIVDFRFHAQFLTQKGRRYYFDSIECLQSYIRENQPTIRSVWVSDFESPGKMLLEPNAVFVQSESIHSPMGKGLGAFRSLERAKSYLALHTGILIQ